MDSTKKRIEYIDLMKGICIILIILLHNQISFPCENLNHILKNMRIPLYFCISGLFFKEYNGFFDFVTRKFNKLMIPFVFFSYFPIILYYIGHKYELKTYILMVIEPYNAPLWFLRCLFITYILYFFFRKFTKKLSLVIQTFIIFFISFFTYILIQYYITLPQNIILTILQNIITAVIALPFFHIASTIKDKKLLSKDIDGKHIIILFSIFLLIWILTFQRNIDYKTIHFGKNFIFLYTSALAGTGCVWCIAYVIKKMFYISYIGRYSLIALGTHYPIILLFNSMGIHNKYITFLGILILMPGVIYVLKKYFPYMTAQKDLFICKNGRLKILINLSSKDHK